MDGTKASILVVDDDPVIRRTVSRGLEPLGSAPIVEASDGLEAMEVLAQQPVDLVVTDVMMPGLDGLGLMREARRRGFDPAWILLSGVETFAAAVEAIQLGAFDFISKPVEVERLRLAVRNALDHRALVDERERLCVELEQRNHSLRDQVEHLERLCDLLEAQADTIQADLERAEVIQRALLPRSPPAMSGFRVETLYRPGRNVGGDLYDVTVVDEHHVAFLIADASGHGVSSAMLSVLFKHHMGSPQGASGAPEGPAAVLERTCRALHDDVVAEGMFVTAAYVLLDTRDGRLTIASAGHPPLLLAGSERVERIPHTGPALGLDPHARYGERTRVLAPGERLLLYTDGVLEEPDANATLGRISGEIASLTPAREALQEIHRKTAQASADADRDDVTMLLVEARDGESHFDDAVVREGRSRPRDTPTDPLLAFGCDGRNAFVRLTGRCTWTAAPELHDRTRSLFDSSDCMIVDLGACTHLDSTMLGTLHEIARTARGRGLEVRVQGVSPTLRALFEELSMQLVLQAITTVPVPLPEMFDAEPPPSKALGTDAHRRILRAHEALAALSEHNRDAFRLVIEDLREEIAGVEDDKETP
jgi:serine phosphatase RsbU (regulator of sigma subunit)/anti-anti-sigma regulatory factor